MTTATVAGRGTVGRQSRRSRGPSLAGGLLRGYFFWLIALLYVPLGILLLFSVNANATLSFPLRGLTLQWYESLLDTPAVLDSARNSVIVAIASSFAATALATMIAILALRFDFPGKRLLISLSVLPLIVPFIVLAVALLLLFRVVGVELSLVTIAIGHTVVALPYALLIILARLAGFDARLEEAAMDLGASYPTTIRLVLLPIIAPSLLSAWIVAFTVSFDEFALALFLAGTEPTFPVYLLSQLRFASRLPVMIALAVLMMIGTLALVLLAEWIRRRGRATAPPAATPGS